MNFSFIEMKLTQVGVTSFFVTHTMEKISLFLTYNCY